MTLIRYTALMSAAAALMLPVIAHTQESAPQAVSGVSGVSGVYGLWLTEAGTGTIRIVDCGPGPQSGTPCGRIATADIPDGEPTTDVNNEDPALRGKPIIGLIMLDGFERSKDKWKKGRIYNPEDGNSYKSSIELDGDDPNTLKVKGCIAFLCQTQRWTRVAEDGSVIGG